MNRSKPYDPEILEKLHNLHVEMIKDLQYVCEKYNINYFAVFGTALGAERHQGFIPWDDDTDVGMLRSDYNKFLSVVEKEIGDKYKILTPEIDKRYACNVTKLQRKGTIFISHLSKDLKCEQCIFLDIFPFDCVASSEKQAKKQYFLTLFLDRLLYLCGTPYPYIPYEGLKKIIATVICWVTHYLTKFLHLSPRFVYKMYMKECKRFNELQTGVVTSWGSGNSLKYKIAVKNMFPVKETKFETITINVLNNNKEHLTKVYGDYMKLPPTTSIN